MPMTPDGRPAKFPKRIRVLSRSDYLKIQSQKVEFKSPYFIILKLKNELGHPRFGFTVSKKVGKSVQRNRARRLIREAVRLNQRLFEDCDYVFIAFNTASKTNFAAVEKELLRYLNRNNSDES